MIDHDARPETWDFLLHGDTGSLEFRAGQLQDAGRAIAEGIAALAVVAFGQQSEATDALQDAALHVSGSLKQAGDRYKGTGAALQTFAIELRPIQQSARGHIGDLVAANGDLQYAENTQRHLMDQVPSVMGAGSPAETDQLQRDMRRAATHVEDAREDVYAIIALLRADDRAREDAADRAIRAIDAVIGEGADSFFDNLQQFVDGAVQALAPIVKWVHRVLVELVETLKNVLETLGLALLVVLALVLVIAVAGSLIMWVLGPSLGLAVILATVGALPLAAAFAAGVIATLVLTFAARERFGDLEHEVVARGRDGVPADHTMVFRPDEDAEAEDYADLIFQITKQDESGTQAGATDIQVVAITDDAGNVLAWRVQCPSTQFWGPNDMLGVNDLSTDVMLSLGPTLRTQYEKAVLDASVAPVWTRAPRRSCSRGGVSAA